MRQPCSPSTMSYSSTVQRVLVTDGAGALTVLEYDMVEGEQGWRIDGVRVLREGEVGA